MCINIIHYSYYGLLISCDRPRPHPWSPSFACALAVLLPWLIVVFIPVVDCCIYFRIYFLYCYFAFLPVPIHPHHRPSIRLCLRRPPSVVDCCIYFVDCWLIVVLFPYFLDCVPILGSMLQRKRGRQCRECARTKDEDEGYGHQRSARTKSEDRRRALTMDIGGR